MSNESTPADHTSLNENPSGNPVEENLKSKATWTRCLYMLISCVLISIASLVGSFVVVLGFFWVLFTGEANQQVRQVGRSIAAYIYQIVMYLTFNSDDKPFPLGGDWPDDQTDQLNG